jgi:hypothetical protein
MNRLTPTPAVPSIMRACASPDADACSTDARRTKASSRPTNRALVYVAGMTAF